MTRKLVTMLVIGLFVGAFTGSAIADVSYSGDMEAFKDAGTVEADMWPASEPVETGAVPGIEKQDRSLSDTHFNPFYPETRSIDLGGGGE